MNAQLSILFNKLKISRQIWDTLKNYEDSLNIEMSLVKQKIMKAQHPPYLLELLCLLS